jgi:hypothetical protein
VAAPDRTALPATGRGSGGDPAGATKQPGPLRQQLLAGSEGREPRQLSRQQRRTAQQRRLKLRRRRGTANQGQFQTTQSRTTRQGTENNETLQLASMANPDPGNKIKDWDPVPLILFSPLCFLLCSWFINTQWPDEQHTPNSYRWKTNLLFTNQNN